MRPGSLRSGILLISFLIAPGFAGVALAAREPAAATPAIATPATAAAPTAAAPTAPGATIQDVQALIAAGHYAAADSAARQLLERAEASGDTASLDTARILDLLVDAMRRGGKASDPEARVLAARAVRLKEARLGPDDPEVATSLNGLGGVLFVNDDYAGARAVWERALAIREKALGPEHPDVGRSLVNLANVLRQEGSYTAARPLYERALVIFEKALGPEHALVAATLNNLAVLLRESGDYTGAERVYEKSVALREKALGPDHPDVATSLTNLANVKSFLGRYAEARALYERALSIREKALGPDHPDVATTLNSLGSLLHNAGDLEGAKPLYERALAIREKALGPEHSEVAWSLSNMGLLLGDTGDYRAARPLLERSLAIWKKTAGPEHPEVANSLSELGALLERSGDLAGARPYVERALAMRRKVLGEQHPDVAASLYQLGDLLARQGRNAEATKLFEQSLALRDQLLGARSAESGMTLAALSRVLLVPGKGKAAAGPAGDLRGQARALRYALIADEIGRENVRFTARTLSEREALNYAALRGEPMAPALFIAARQDTPVTTRQVWDSLVQSRALVLDEMAARHHDVLNAVAPDVRLLSDSLTATRSELARLLVRDEADSTARSLLDVTRRRKDDQERRLAVLTLPYRKEPGPPTGFDEMAQALPWHGAVVAYVRYGVDPQWVGRPSGPPEFHYLAFVLNHVSDPRTISIGTAAEVDALVEAWRAAVSVEPADSTAAGEDEMRRAGEALRRKIWDPVAPFIGQAEQASLVSRAEQVFVVLDGSLNLVNLAALPDDEGNFLIEKEAAIHYLSTERDLIRTPPAGTGKGLLALGGPDYDAADVFAALENTSPRAIDPEMPRARPAFRGLRPRCGDFRKIRFEPLPGSEKETADLALLWKRRYPAPADSVISLSGARAAESAFKADAPGRQVVHLATHGFFLGGMCAPGAGSRGVGGLVAAPAPAGSGTAAASPPENPLLLSGLALAGANHRESAQPGEDDGILTAEEIAALDLSGVEWAVLSACDTGLGEETAGEGVFGLRRAFQIAGAGSLIMSLWSVDDQVTRTWMRALYDQRLKDRPTIDAVRNATLRVLRARREAGESTNPFYWGGFVAAGDWR